MNGSNGPNGLPPGARVNTVGELTARINDYMQRGRSPRESFLSACHDLDLHFPEPQIEAAVRSLEAEQARMQEALGARGAVGVIQGTGIVVERVHPDDALEIAARATMKPQ